MGARNGGGGVTQEEEEWHKLEFQALECIRGRLLERGYAPSTVNLTLAALKGIARYARDLGLTTAEEHDRVRWVRGARGQRVPPGRAIAGDELAALAAACAADDGPAGARDLALLATLRVGGVRRAELAGLALDDYRHGARRGSAGRRGKGDKGREIPLNAAAAALAAWLARRGGAPGALFTRIDRWGNVDPCCRPVSTQAVYAIVEKRVAEAAVAASRPTTSAAPSSATSSTPATPAR